MMFFYITILLFLLSSLLVGRLIGRLTYVGLLRMVAFYRRGLLVILDQSPSYFELADFLGTLKKASMLSEFVWLTPERYSKLKIWSGVVVAALLSLGVFMNFATSGFMVLVIVCTAVLFWDDAWVYVTYQKKEDHYNKTLSGIVDNMSLMVSCGLTIDQAVAKLLATRKDYWKEIFSRAQFQTSAGLPMYLALEKAGSRSGSEEFRQVTQIIKQSAAYGTPLSEVLRVQSELIRMKRKQKAEEKARTASVRIILPLVLCIFPALLTVFLMPAVLRLSNGF